MNILIPIETASRELLYKVNLCHHLAKKGFQCYLGRKAYINILIENQKYFIYLDKGYNKVVSDKLYKIINQNGGTIVSLDEEGGVDYSDGSTLIRRYTKTLFNNSDLTFLWGDKQYGLVKKYFNKNNKVAITGHPRFELLKPEFHYYYQDEVNEIKDEYQDFILINTNMGFGNNIRGDDFVLSNYRDRFKNIDQMVNFDKKKLEAFRALIIKLSQHLNITIVLRPHPEEDQAFYINAFKECNNVHVIYKGSVVPWILASKIMIHPDCTTAIESLFMEKKPLSYLPSQYPKELVTHLPIEASECFTSISKIISFIEKNINSRDKINFENYKFSMEYFSISKPTTKLIVDYICALRDRLHLNHYQELKLKTLIYLKYRSLRASKLMFNEDRLMNNKLDGFNSKNILNYSKLCTLNQKICSDISINKINNQLFKFYCNK